MTNDTPLPAVEPAVETPQLTEHEIKPLRERRVSRCHVRTVVVLINLILYIATGISIYLTVDAWPIALVIVGVFLCGVSIGLHIVFHHIHLKFIDLLHMNPNTHKRIAWRMKRMLKLTPDQTEQVINIFRRRLPELMSEAAPIAQKHFWTLYNDVHLLLNQEQRERHEFFLRELERHLRIAPDNQ